MKAPDYKHYFTIVNGKFVWEDLDMLNYKRKSLEGKRSYAIIKEVKHNITPNQYAYYFGGIIRKECMASDTFQGLSEKEIHQILFHELRSSTKGVKLPDGTTKLVEVTDDFGVYSKEEMARYIDEVIALLQTEYNIYPKPATHYKYNKFYIDPKVVK